MGVSLAQHLSWDFRSATLDNVDQWRHLWSDNARSIIGQQLPWFSVSVIRVKGFEF